MQKTPLRVLFLFFFKILILFSFSITSVFSDSKKLFFPNTNNYYQLFSRPFLSWKQAKQSCIHKKAHLATLTSKAENDFILSKFRHRHWPWLGASNESGAWQWVTGEDFIFTQWLTGFPKYSFSSLNYGNNVWADRKGRERRPYVCEWEAKNTVNTPVAQPLKLKSLNSEVMMTSGAITLEKKTIIKESKITPLKQIPIDPNKVIKKSNIKNLHPKLKEILKKQHPKTELFEKNFIGKVLIFLLVIVFGVLIYTNNLFWILKRFFIKKPRKIRSSSSDNRTRMLTNLDVTASSLKQTKINFEITLNKFKNIISGDDNLLDNKYALLNTQYEICLFQYNDVKKNFMKIENVKKSLFKEWNKELDFYSDFSLYRLSKKKLKISIKNYTTLMNNMHKFKQQTELILSLLKNQELSIKHNINLATVESQHHDFKKLETAIFSLTEVIQKTLKDTQKFSANLG